jgi:hypothetical protein
MSTPLHLQTHTPSVLAHPSSCTTSSVDRRSNCPSFRSPTGTSIYSGSNVTCLLSLLMRSYTYILSRRPKRSPTCISERAPTEAANSEMVNAIGSDSIPSATDIDPFPILALTSGWPTWLHTRVRLRSACYPGLIDRIQAMPQHSCAHAVRVVHCLLDCARSCPFT